MWNLFKSKTADPMQQVQPTDPALSEMEKIAQHYKKELAASRIRAFAQAGQLVRAHDKLREIVAAETPACAGIGRKMARIAREGLPEFAVPAEQEAA